MNLSDLDAMFAEDYFAQILATEIRALELGDWMFQTDSSEIIAALRAMPLEEAVKIITEAITEKLKKRLAETEELFTERRTDCRRIAEVLAISEMKRRRMQIEIDELRAFIATLEVPTQ